VIDESELLSIEFARELDSMDVRVVRLCHRRKFRIPAVSPR
jgi:hypothetical protein